MSNIKSTELLQYYWIMWSRQYNRYWLNRRTAAAQPCCERLYEDVKHVNHRRAVETPFKTPLEERRFLLPVPSHKRSTLPSVFQYFWDYELNHKLSATVTLHQHIINKLQIIIHKLYQPKAITVPRRNPFLFYMHLPPEGTSVVFYVQTPKL